MALRDQRADLIRVGTTERTAARALGRTTTLGVWLAALGTVLMLAAGRSPFESPGPGGSLLGVDSASVIRLGVVAFVVGPTLRVVAALAGFARAGERLMVAISIGILGIIAIDVLVAGLGV